MQTKQTLRPNPTRKCLLALTFFLFSLPMFSQGVTGISIAWDQWVGCQEYSNIVRDGVKYAITLEDIDDNVTCLRFCDKSTVTYTLSGILGSNPSTLWSVNGGTVVSSADNQIVVKWEGIGSASLSFIINTPNGIVTKNICIEKIAIPIAQFTVVPAPSIDRDLYSCTNQAIYFTNQSIATNGNALVAYRWDFGDGYLTTEFEPIHTYSQPGDYSVTLTVYNQCNCSSKISKTVKVSEPGFDISCPTVICENDQTIYSLPGNVSELCKDTYNWSAIGGTINSIDPGSGSATVTWDNVDAAGFGYISFNTSECKVACLSPTTAKIPVIKQQGTITGDINICAKTQSVYKLPQWPSTDVTWEVIGNVNNSLAIITLLEQENEVAIKPLNSGQITLRAVYTNTLLRCGGTAQLVINVSPAITINGPEYVCKDSTVHYETSGGVVTSWTLKKNFTVIDFVASSSSYDYTFIDTGTFTLIAGPAGFCNGADKVITVTAAPVAPNASNVIGNRLVCPNAPYTYSLPADPNVIYHWSATNGTLLGSETGNTVSIKFTGATPAEVKVYSEVLAPATCVSTTATVAISIQDIPVVISAPAETICANSSALYQAIDVYSTGTYTDGEIYQWSIIPSTLGSIVSGQGTHTAGILWNNVNAITDVVISLEIRKCTLTKMVTKTIHLLPLPNLVITASPSTVCSGDPVTFTVSSSNGVALDPLAVVNWNFGAGPANAGLTQNHTFSNISGANIGVNVTASISNPNGCTGNTNTASASVTVLPGPPAAASTSSENNSFCNELEIDVTLTAATGLSGIAIQWYNGTTPIPAPEGNADVLYVTGDPGYGFGVYSFTATNIATGCSTRSNDQYVVQNCGSVECEYSPIPTLTNTSTQDCGVISLTGSATGTPVTEFWRISGPSVNVNNYTASTFTVTEAGDFHVIKLAGYLNENEEICTFSVDKIVTVPYIPNFSYVVNCNGNNTFTIDLTDQTNFYALVDNRSVQYYYRQGFTGTWIGPMSGNTISGVTAPNVQVKIVVSGNLNGVPQAACEKVINIPLAVVPSQTIVVSPVSIPCSDTSILFRVSGIAAPGDTYLWTFEPGAESTLAISSRVFSSLGSKTISVVITNRFGCTRELTTTINIPEPCFNGDLVSTPTPAIECQGNPITISYNPNGDNCAVSTYTWMNGLTPVTPASNAPSIVVTDPGFYWVKLQSVDGCSYETQNRIVPDFKVPPGLRLQGPAATCFGTDVTIDATTEATSIRWWIDGIPQLALSDQTSVTIPGLSVGNHTVTATAYSPEGCGITENQIVSIVPSPDIPVITIQVFCAGDDPDIPYYHVVLNAVSNVVEVFNWSNGMTGHRITVADGGPMMVTITSGGCTSSSQVDVPKNPLDFIWIFPTGCVVDCKSDADPAYLIGPRLPLYPWEWFMDSASVSTGTDDFADDLPLSQSGKYSFELNTRACAATAQALDYRLLDCQECDIESISIGEITRLNNDFCAFSVNLTISSGYTTVASLSAPNGQVVIDPSILTINSGTHSYNITVFPVDGFTGGLVKIRIDATLPEGVPCIYEFRIQLPSCIENSQGRLAGEWQEAQSVTRSVVLSPNPASEQVSVNYRALPLFSSLAIYDLTGRQLFENQLPEENGAVNISTSIYPAGVYLVVVRSQGKIISQQKLSVQ